MVKFFAILFLTLAGALANDVAIDATLEEFPFVVAIGFDLFGSFEYQCSGTLLNEFWVLTVSFKKQFCCH
jgi:hypothetical protein